MSGAQPSARHGTPPQHASGMSVYGALSDGLETAALCHRDERSLFCWEKVGRGEVFDQPLVVLSVQARIFVTQAVAPVLNARHDLRSIDQMVVNPVYFREVRVICPVERSCDGHVRPIVIGLCNGAMDILAKSTQSCHGMFRVCLYEL